MGDAPLDEHLYRRGDDSRTNYSVNVSLKNGDTVDFAIAPNGPDWNDATQFSSSILSITLLNQPAGEAALRDTSGAIRLSTYAASILSNSGGAFSSDPSASVTPRDPRSAIGSDRRGRI